MPERSVAVRIAVRDVEQARRRLLGLGTEGQQALAKIEASAPAASRALQTVDRSANRLRFGIGNAANQIGDFVVQVSAGTSAMRAFSLQAPQMLAGFGPQGAIIGTIAALVGGLAAAFLDAGNEADRFREDAERLRGELDRQVDTVEALRAKYAELTAEQRLNREVNLRAEMAALEREQDRLIRQLDDLVLEFGQVGAAMAGIGEGSGELTRTINEFLTGAIGPQELIDQLDRLRDTVGRDNEEFAALADRARELANELLGAELGAQRAQNELEALRQIAAGVTGAMDDQAGATGRAADATDKLTGAQKRLAEAGRILLRTSAQEERFDAEAERLERLRQEWERLDRELQSQREEREDALTEPFDNALASIQARTADTFEEIFEGGITSFSDLADQVRQIFTRLAAELAALMVFRPQLVGAAASASGVAPSLASQLAAAPAAGGPGRRPSIVGFPGTPGAQALAGQSMFLGMNAIGSGLLGAGIGTTAGSVIGGSGTGAAIGSAAGALIGAAAGSFIPVIGTALGAFLGGAGGGLIGGFFGGDSENTGALRFRSTATGFGPFGGFAISGEDRFTAPVTNAVRQFDEGVAAFLGSRTEAQIAEALQALPQFSDRFPESDPSEGIFKILRQRARVVLGAAGLNAQAILAGAGSAEDIARRTQEALQLQRTIGELTGELNRFDIEMADLTEQFEDAARKAEAFGISTEGLAEAQERATRELERRQQAELDALALSIVEPFERLAGPLRAFETQLEFSLLNPAEQAARAAEDFRRLAAEAAEGSTVAIEQLVGAGQLFIEQAGRFGASPAQVSAIEEVRDVLRDALGRIESARQEAERGVEGAVERAQERIVDTLRELMEEVRTVADEVNRLRRDTA